MSAVEPESQSARIEALEGALRDVLAHIRRQGHANWGLHTCLVTDKQVAQWRAVLDATSATAHRVEGTAGGRRALGPGGVASAEER